MPDETQDNLDDVMFEASETPLLLRKPVVGAVIVLFLATVALYFVATQFWGLSFKVDAEPFQEWVEDQGPLGPVVFIAVMAASVLFAPIPNIPIFIAAGLAWGTLLGTLYCMIGLTIGSGAAFWVARKFGRHHLPKLIGRHAAERLDHMVDNMGGRVVFFSRLMPGVNFDWISFVAGMTSVRFRTFIVYSALGMLPLCALTVAMGDALQSDPRWTLAAGGVWVVAVVATAAYFWARRKHWRAPAKPSDTGVNPEAELG
jgi:uncharacterized membrane protein YdjX (TVP38/TMEM64 family)